MKRFSLLNFHATLWNPWVTNFFFFLSNTGQVYKTPLSITIGLTYTIGLFDVWHRGDVNTHTHGGIFDALKKISIFKVDIKINRAFFLKKILFFLNLFTHCFYKADIFSSSCFEDVTLEDFVYFMFARISEL